MKTMKLIHTGALTILLIQLQCYKVFTEDPFDKECLVKDSLIFSLQEYTSIDISFFMTLDNPVTIQVTFVGLKVHKDNDLLLLETKSGTLERKRNGKKTTHKLTPENPVPLGWNSMGITVHNDRIQIGNFLSLTEKEHKISEISIRAEYLTNCINRTPMWNIKKSDEVSIPVKGLSSIGIKLYSVQPFLPDIDFNDLKLSLSYEDELYFKKSNLLLPPQEYRIEVVTFNKMISIFGISENEEHTLIIKANIKEDLVNLIVRSLEGEFTLLIDPFRQKYHREECKLFNHDPEIHEEHTMNTKLYNGVNESTHPSHSNNTNEVLSCTTWQVICGLYTAIAALSLSIFIYRWLPKRMTPSNKMQNMEEGEATVPLLNKDPVKNYIKSKHTEPCGEVNKLMNPHYKEVCKIKLRSDKENFNMKMQEELDSNKPTKVILVVGQTGSGKSSFINAMTNYIYGIKYEDEFRFKLIDDIDSSVVSGTNNTDEFTAYYIPFMTGIECSCNYIFVDTPGFGDARGIQVDNKFNQKFHEFLFKNPNITEVDGICYVVKATDTRLTLIQKYIINGLFSMFGVDIKNNIYAVVSFSDGTESHVPELLQNSGLEYNLALQLNSNGLYNEGISTSTPSSDVLYENKKNWDMTMKDLEPFFKLLARVTPVSLSLTNVVLEENEDIEKLKNELLALRVKEHAATDQERQDIQSKIEENQELLMNKLVEAQKLSGRLENIPAKKNPLIINEYIDKLIKSELNQDKIIELQKLKDRNTAFQKLMKDKKSTKSLVNYILGEKTEKTE